MEIELEERSKREKYFKFREKKVMQKKSNAPLFVSNDKNVVGSMS